MVELTSLETRLAEVLGLSTAARIATERVLKLDGLSSELEELLVQMQSEAEDAEARATELAASLDGRAAAILDEARDVTKRAEELMSKYLESPSGALEGFEYLTMAAAGEVVHWEILDSLAEHANDDRIRELCAWALPVRRQRLGDVRRGAVELAR